MIAPSVGVGRLMGRLPTSERPRPLSLRRPGPFAFARCAGICATTAFLRCADCRRDIACSQAPVERMTWKHPKRC